ncbi:hypothetical protein, conserved [Trypanosoma vivax Y486]|uniref:Uncharacterized protein n=1 Tax=Trypanosoma vivax (strain Y486) TaxID=1055687 RepID=F9WVU4_TRYVY|nr:hypothetical protein, conserved [Trypanosoma vivax Y486]|eukprot:CCD21705.1 hypothetical protein, conserved [Trypanosoma vivax Y486]
MKSILQPISMLKVHKPLITRANVVKNSLLIIPQVVDPSSVRGNGRLATGNRSSIVDVSSVVMCDGAETDSSDVDDWPLTSNVQSSCGLGKSSGTSVAPAVTNMDERVDILEFMERRRRELAEQSRRYFVPIELELRALCGMARLTVEPSEHLIRLPAYVREQRCTQMILLINKSCAMMSFLLELSSPSFSIASTRLASLGDTYDELEVEDEEVLLMRRAMENLKWCRLSERLRARRLVRGSGRKEAATKGGMEILLEEPPTGRVGAAASTGESGYVATKYQLCPHDELEVIIEYNHPSVDELSSLIAHTPTVEATLDILFLPSDTPAPKVSQSPVKEPKQTFHPPPVLELRQSIPLLLTLSKLPESTASPC